MGTTQRNVVRSTMIALSAMFAGLTFNPRERVDKFHGAFGEDKMGQRSRNRCRSRYYNRHDKASQKWDFQYRSNTAGCGYFKNRTTGEVKHLRIANPQSTKTDPVRELSLAAKNHFALAVEA